MPAFNNLTPFEDKESRIEYMLVEYDNVLVNVNYCILMHLKENIKTLEGLLIPGAELTDAIKTQEKHNLYEYGKILTLDHMLSNLFIDPSAPEVQNVLKSVNYNLKDYSFFIANGMPKLLDSNKIQNICVAISHFYNQTQIDSIMSIFTLNDKHRSKLKIYDISPYECLKKTSGFTTIMVSDVEELYKIISDKSIDTRFSQLVLMKKVSNTVFAEMTLTSPDGKSTISLPFPKVDYKYTKEINDYQKAMDSRIAIMDQYYSDYY